MQLLNYEFVTIEELSYKINNLTRTQDHFIQLFCDKNNNLVHTLKSLSIQIPAATIINTTAANNIHKKIYKNSKTIISLCIVNEKKVSKNKNNTLSILKKYKIALNETLMISKTNARGEIIYANKSFLKYSGYSKSELLGNTHNLLKCEKNHPYLYMNMWNHIKRGKTWNGIYSNLSKNKKRYHVKSTIFPINDNDQNINEIICLSTKVSNFEIKEKKHIDKLTSLKNREALFNLFKKKQTDYLLILLNLDRFSEINYYFGYDIGDELLKIFSRYLLNIFKNNVYRVTGDEFAIVCEEKNCKNILRNINEIITDLENKTYKIKEYEISINTTVGMALSSSKDIYKLAYISLKEAKEKRKKISFFNLEPHLKDKMKNTINMIDKIKSAINNDRIIPYFQGIVNNKTKKIEKYESLMRMIDEDGTILSPFAFLEHSKKAKLYDSLTKIMFRKTFEAFKNNSFCFSINLTIHDILSENTRKFLLSLLKEYKCGNRVVLEIVESEGIENFEEINSFIKIVKKYGCKIAIDDFGSGYSNFSYLSKLQLDYIKIDGSLIKDLNNDDSQRTIVESILLYTKKQGLKTVAEFVENEEIYEQLCYLGIDYSQGYYFCKPSPIIQTQTSLSQAV